MRSIGKKNIRMVQELTRTVKKQLRNEGDRDTIEDRVIAQLPSSLWETWECADQEIRSIIWDTSWEDIGK